MSEFNFMDHIPEGYVCEVHHLKNCTVTTWRNPNPDPEEHARGIQDVTEFLLKARMERLQREKAEREEAERLRAKAEKEQEQTEILERF